MARRFGRDLVSFMFVYILEAHAYDEWPISCLNEVIPQHRNVSDRAEAAKILQQTYPLDSNVTMILDNEDNDFSRVFAAWPFRYCVLKDGRVELKMGLEKDGSVSLRQLKSWMHGYAQTHAHSQDTW